MGSGMQPAFPTTFKCWIETISVDFHLNIFPVPKVVIKIWNQYIPQKLM